MADAIDGRAQTVVRPSSVNLGRPTMTGVDRRTLQLSLYIWSHMDGHRNAFNQINAT